MTDGNGENKDEINGDIDVIWWILGAVAGVALTAKYIQFLGVARDEELPLSQGMLMLACMFGPAVVLGLIADQFRKEVQRGRMPWEVYWTVLSGIAASVFAFLGVTGIDDILEAGKFLFSSDG
ncbi:hypothetical protein [Saccharopolyspora sp. CA-218241]|uniref:hypothetical protein n=1 Tax=Saccharopolyspora sp. CA-218241 TaxID=3240027 RepID=UPI003D99B93D